jgi:exonuclease SbcC
MRERAMQLLRLQMRNFKRFRHQDVVFRDGITGILGNNGTGKSSLVDAILFCLYGVKETGIDYILSATAGPRERAEVRLDLSVRGEEFQMVRSLGPQKRHDVQLHRDGRLMAKGVSEVRDALGKVIRMGHADFRHTIFSGQRELLTLVEATPEERKRWFRRVLGIDSLKDEGGEILRGEIVAAREEMLLLEGRLGENEPEAIHGQMVDLAARIAGTDQALRSLDEELTAFGARRRALETEMSDLRDREKESLRLRTMIRNRDEERARIQEELGGITREIEALEVQKGEFEVLEASEPGFEDWRTRLEASRERRVRFQILSAGEALTGALVADVEKALERLRDEEASLGRDEKRLEALGPSARRRAEALARLKEIGTLEDRYRTLLAAIAKKDESLSGAAKRGADLRSWLEKIQGARARLAELMESYHVTAPPAGDPVAVLESRHRELLGVIGENSAIRDRAASALAKREADLAILEARGTGGDCPTCHQPLGTRYREIVDGIRAELEEERVIISRADETLRKADEERSALESALAEARRLREVCNRAGEVSLEWEAVQDRSRRDLAEKEALEREMHALAYDPMERQGLEAEVASLEGPWREHVAISDRLRRRPALDRSLRETGERLERLKVDLARAIHEREALGFDPGLHARLEEEFRMAEDRHRRFLQMKPEMDRLPYLRERAAGLAEKIREAGRDLARFEDELEEIPFTPDQLAQKETELRSVQQEALRTTQLAAKCRADRTHLGEERQRLSDLLLKFELDRKEHDRLGDLIGMLELTREHLNGFTDHLLGVVRDQIQEETGRILSDITDGRYDTVILDDAFGLVVHDLGGDYPVSRFSGGEQDDVAIALRIALSRYIAEMHELHDSTFLIFDEIFGSQDEERRGNIFRALRALEPYFPQIFLISHVTEVQGEFGNTLVVEAVSERESRVRDLEEVEA